MNSVDIVEESLVVSVRLDEVPMGHVHGLNEILTLQVAEPTGATRRSLGSVLSMYWRARPPVTFLRRSALTVGCLDQMCLDCLYERHLKP